MYPHYKSLLSIALVSHFDANKEATETLLSTRLVTFCRHPTKFGTLLKEALPADRYILLNTTNKHTSNGKEIFNTIAKELGIDNYVKDFELSLPRKLLSWRSDKPTRMFLETMLLCGMTDAQISDDYKACYNVNLDMTCFNMFKDMFMDINFAVGNGWEVYMTSIDTDEAMYKGRLTKQSSDYVRWILGVPVALDSDTVLSRLESDAYFTIRSIKNTAGGNGVTLTDDAMRRIKFETEVLMKVLDRRVKIKQAEAEISAGASVNVAEAIKNICIEFEDHENRLIGELE